MSHPSKSHHDHHSSVSASALAPVRASPIRHKHTSDDERVIVRISEPAPRPVMMRRPPRPRPQQQQQQQPQVIVLNNTIPAGHTDHHTHSSSQPTRSSPLSHHHDRERHQRRPTRYHTKRVPPPPPHHHHHHKPVVESSDSDSSVSEACDSDVDDAKDARTKENEIVKEEEEEAVSDQDVPRRSSHGGHGSKHHGRSGSLSRQSRVRRLFGWFRPGHGQANERQSIEQTTSVSAPSVAQAQAQTPAPGAPIGQVPISSLAVFAAMPSPTMALSTGQHLGAVKSDDEQHEPFVFELEKWCGAMWYDIAHIPTFWEAPPWSSNPRTTDYTSLYSMMPHSSHTNEHSHYQRPHKFRVHNTSIRGGRHISEITGTATIDTQYRPLRLGDPLVKADIHFPPVFATLFANAIQVKGDFWIYHVQEGIYRQDPYRWAIISERHKRHCWLIARTPTLGAEDLAKARSIVTAIGIKPERLVITRHLHGCSDDDTDADHDSDTTASDKRARIQKSMQIGHQTGHKKH